MTRKFFCHGFTMIELLVIIFVIAILAVTAVPSLMNYVQTNRVKASTQQLYYALQYARSEAIKRNANIYISFTTGKSWCYGINTGSACTCTTASNCNLGATAAANANSMTLSTSGITSGSFHFEPNHGAANISGVVTYTTNDTTESAGVKISLLGSLQVCSSQLPGYQACT